MGFSQSLNLQLKPIIIKAMKPYIDGFVFPLARKHLEAYGKVAEQVAKIWKEHGALSYHEYLGNDLKLGGTRSFSEAADLEEGEVVIFGWVVFPSKELRDKANQAVPKDPRMAELVVPLMDPNNLIFDAKRMIYGGFEEFIG